MHIQVTSVGTSVAKFLQPGTGSVSYVFYSSLTATFRPWNHFRLCVTDEFAHHLVVELGHESLLYKMAHLAMSLGHTPNRRHALR